MINKARGAKNHVQIEYKFLTKTRNIAKSIKYKFIRKTHNITQNIFFNN